jgi:polar amino acid transport system substrate-binding protein
MACGSASGWPAATPPIAAAFPAGHIYPEFLGNGLAIAAPKDKPELAAAFDYALQAISAKGTFAELYLRYFPVSFF